MKNSFIGKIINKWSLYWGSTLQKRQMIKKKWNEVLEK